MPSVSELQMTNILDLVGTSSLKLNEKLNFDYNFSIDQNYSDLNYSEIASTLNLDLLKIDFNYLKEMKHIVNDEYLKTKNRIFAKIIKNFL